MLNTGGFIGEGWRIYPGWKVARINCIIYIRRIRVLFVILFENIFQLGSILFLFIPPTFIFYLYLILLSKFLLFTRSILMILSDSFILHGYCSISLVSPFGFLTNYLIIPFIIFILLLINFYLFIYLFFFSISRLFYWYYSSRILFMSVINLRQIPFIYLYQFHSLSF